MHFTLWLGMSIVCETGYRSNICHPPNYSIHTLSVGESIFKPRGRAIITRNVDLVSAPNRDIAGEAVVEDRLFLELQGHTGLPSGNVHHFLNVGHVAHQRQIIKIHPRSKTSEKYFHCSADWFPLSVVHWSCTTETWYDFEKKKNQKKNPRNSNCIHLGSYDIVIMAVIQSTVWYFLVQLSKILFYFFQLTGLFVHIFLLKKEFEL